MISFDTAISGGNVNPGTSLSWAHTCSGINRALVVFTRGGNNEGDKVTGVTYAGSAMTKAGAIECPAGTNQWLDGFFILNPASGSNNIVVSLTSGYLEAVSYSSNGVLQTGFPDSYATNTGHSVSSLTVSTTTILDNCWTVLGVIGSSLTAGSGSTVRVTNNQVGAFDSNGVIHPAGSTSMSVGMSVSDTAGIIMSFAPASTGGGSFLINLL